MSTTPQAAWPEGTGVVRREARGSPLIVSGTAVAVGVGVTVGVGVEVGLEVAVGGRVGVAAVVAGEVA